MTSIDTTRPNCDATSVGVLITDPDGRILLFERVKPPYGLAPVAGHIDEHGGAAQAAVAEVAEEVGLEVTSLRWVSDGWVRNHCRRSPHPGQAGHHWTVYRADWTGQVRLGADEARRPRWVDHTELQALVARTVAYAHGDIDDTAWGAEPGLEPVWVSLLPGIGLPAADLAAVIALYARTPHGAAA